MTIVKSDKKAVGRPRKIVVPVVCCEHPASVVVDEPVVIIPEMGECTSGYDCKRERRPYIKKPKAVVAVFKAPVDDVGDVVYDFLFSLSPVDKLRAVSILLNH